MLDLRYEILTPPTDSMWEAMRDASQRLGVASSGEDETVRTLERRFAELTAKEAALFLPTTTSGTILGLRALGIGGKQIIMEDRCHLYWMEGRHFADAGGVPSLIRGDRLGTMALTEIEGRLNRSYYGERIEAAVVALENPHNLCGGTCLSAEYTAAVADLAHSYGVRVMLDGARLIRAAVAQNVTVGALAAPVDVVVIAPGKDLGAPGGGILCGSRRLIERARAAARGMGAAQFHRGGMLAAAVLQGLEELAPRLREDHKRARDLALGVQGIPGLRVDLESVQTNCVRVELVDAAFDATYLAGELAANDLAVHPIEGDAFKMMTYPGIRDTDVRHAVTVIAGVMRAARRREASAPADLPIAAQTTEDS